MTITERVAYLKGLAEGMKIDGSTNEGKLMLEIIGVLNDMALTLDDYGEALDDMEESISEVEESVYGLEDKVFGDEDEFDDSEFDDDLYDITCSKCDNVITVDYDILDSGSVVCPNCGEKIEFDIEVADKEDGDCGCGNDR